jgi:hypothetical protein
MNSSVQMEIENQISRYIAGQSSLAEFHNWLIPVAWDIDRDSQPAKRLAHRAQLLLAEFSNGDRSEDELRSELWNLLNRVSITITVVYGSVSPVSMLNTSVTQGAGTVVAMSPAGMLPATVLA